MYQDYMQPCTLGIFQLHICIMESIFKTITECFCCLLFDGCVIVYITLNIEQCSLRTAPSADSTTHWLCLDWLVVVRCC